MGTQCKVCLHPDHAMINEMLLAGQSQREVMRKFTGLSVYSMWNHTNHHLPQIESKKRNIQHANKTEELWQMLEKHLWELNKIAQKGKKASDPRLQLDAFNTASKYLKIVADLLKDVKLQVTNVLIVQKPEWMTIKVAIEKSLRPYPDARRALLEALRDLDPDIKKDFSQLSLPAPTENGEIIDVNPTTS